ncbi:MAG: hypothetical protein ACYCPW_11140 [Nitrososphaerales archaeon]
MESDNPLAVMVKLGVPLGSKYPIVEAGEKSLLFHGLNWDIP